MKRLRYAAEAMLAWGLYASMKLVGLKAASAFGGWLAGRVGPKTKVHRVALYNVRRAMPQLSDEQAKQIVAGMWDNLGRTVCEYPHLTSRAMQKCVHKVDGQEYLQQALASGRPVFIISGHLGNWELPPVVSAQMGVRLHLLYRAANNPLVNRLIVKLRKPYTLGLHDKGRHAARAIMCAMRQGEPVAMLVDQKHNKGIEVPFFGEGAMTNDAVAHLVLKHNALVLPARCIRHAGCQFSIQVEPAMEFRLSGDKQANIQQIMRQINALLERWISQDPAQWFWLHKRWPYSKKMH